MIHRSDSSIDRAQALDLGYSLRRHFLDRFHSRHVPELPANGLVLDLGGTRIRKRGLFDLGRYPVRIIYANLSTSKQPDVQADAALLPFPGSVFDAVICSELLEHVPAPVEVVSEMHRVLKTGGVALICVPFMNRIHGDPFDYGRYTDFYWNRILTGNGFGDVQIERQGLYWCVMADMLRDLAYARSFGGLWKQNWALRLLCLAMAAAKRRALEWDARIEASDNSSLQGYTTGFGIRAVKL